MLKDFWKGKLRFDWTLGLWLILIFGMTRFVAVLYGIQTEDNKYLSLIFTAMIALPFIILSKEGKSIAKIKRPKNLLSLIKSFLLGIVICVFIYFIGQLLYADSSLNWFRYIGECYPMIEFETISESDKTIYFYIFLGIGMTFSPLGEELLYRGLIHTSLINRFGDNKSAILDSLAFGFTHLAHYGILYQNNSWNFHLGSSLIWITLMFATGLIFNYCKRMSDSIWGAIVSHMAFNMTMTYLIFYHIF